MLCFPEFALRYRWGTSLCVPPSRLMQNVSSPRIALIALLSIVAAALLAVLLFAYLSGKEVADVQMPAPPAVVPDYDKNSVAAGDTSLSEEELASSGGESAPDEIRVYVAGSVLSPDVYTLRMGDRLVDALAAAGGPTAEADLEAVNLALKIEDQGYYYLPEKRQAVEKDGPASTSTEAPGTEEIPQAATSPVTGGISSESEKTGSDEDVSGQLIDINTADQAMLETLPGIGPARASAIIAYRDQHGPFVSVDELTAVSGIGQITLENVRTLVTVGR